MKSKPQHGRVESGDFFIRSVVDEDRLSFDERELGEESGQIQRLGLSVLVEPSRGVGRRREGRDPVGGQEERRGGVGEPNQVEL